MRRQHAHDAPRGWRCSRRSAPTPASASRRAGRSKPSASATTRYFLALAQRHGTDRALWAPGRRSTSPGSTPRSTTSTRRSDGRSARPTPNRRSRCAAALGRYWLMRDRYADAVDWIDQALSQPGADAHPAPARPRALRQGQALWPLGRADEQPRVMAGGRGRRPRSSAIPLSSREPSSAPPARPVPTGSMSRRRSPTRRFTGRRACGDEWAIAMAASPARWPRARSPSFASASTGPPRCSRRSATCTARGPAHLRRLCAVLRQRSRRQGVRQPRDSDRANSTTRSCGCSQRGNFGLAALLTGDTDAAASSVPRGAHALPRTGRAALCVRRPQRPRRRRRGPRRRPPRRAASRGARRTPLRPTEDPVDARLDTELHRARPAHGAGPDAWTTAARRGRRG